MDYGAIKSYFSGVGAKRLAPVDVDPESSNQHEFNGVRQLRDIFGDGDIKRMETTYVYLDDSGAPVFDYGTATWYDARRNNPTRTEYRLYYSGNEAMERAIAGDLMVVAVTEGGASSAVGELLIIFASAGSTIESQVRWLFGLDGLDESGFSVSESDTRIDAVAAEILETIGIEISIPTAADMFLEGLVAKFGESFPTGVEFTEYSISTLGILDWKGDPDGSLQACYQREELLYRVFERHLLERDFEPYIGSAFDVDALLRISMSTFQRRKSRAGSAFENQLSCLFDKWGIKYSAQKFTEGKSKPDFVFPSIEDYHDPSFPDARLVMLGAKTTIKERWRQVLDEADRIVVKHLVTLEPAVSENYTKAMAKDMLQLVTPVGLFKTYNKSQRSWLMSVKDFCEMVLEKQKD